MDKHRATIIFGVTVLVCAALIVTAYALTDTPTLIATIGLALLAPATVGYMIFNEQRVHSRTATQRLVTQLMDMRLKQSRKEFEILTQISYLNTRLMRLESNDTVALQQHEQNMQEIAKGFTALGVQVAETAHEEPTDDREHEALTEVLLSLMLKQDEIVRALRQRNMPGVGGHQEGDA